MSEHYLPLTSKIVSLVPHRAAQDAEGATAHLQRAPGLRVVVMAISGYPVTYHRLRASHVPCRGPGATVRGVATPGASHPTDPLQPQGPAPGAGVQLPGQGGERLRPQ